MNEPELQLRQAILRVAGELSEHAAEDWDLHCNALVDELRPLIGAMPPVPVKMHPSGAIATLREVAEMTTRDSSAAAPVSYQLLREAMLEHNAQRIEFENLRGAEVKPLPLYLTCPICGARHIDEGEFATKPHHTHSCQKCGLTWRPAIEPTVGVQFLPGFKND